MRALHLMWLMLALPGVVETFRVLLAARRTYLIARANSTDRHDWEIACHELWTERIRVVKQLLVVLGIYLGLPDVLKPWQVESRNLVLVAISLLLLVNSERDLLFRRRVRIMWANGTSKPPLPPPP